MLLKNTNDCNLIVETEMVVNPEGYKRIVFIRQMMNDGKVTQESKFDMYLTAEEVNKLKQAL
jgi:hypothetical protein